jgi:hypothetical protein
MRQIRKRLMLLVLLCLFGLVFAYGLSRYGVFEIPNDYDPFAVPDLTAEPNILIPLKMKLLDADIRNCRFAFARAGKPVIIEPSRSEGSDCVKQGTIKLANLSLAKIRTEETRCAIAARLYMWEHNVVQPAAQKYFDEPVAEILHFGSYSCRNIRGSSSMSEHATANAFDISGFRLKSGKLISIQQQWQSSSPDARFLRALREGACDYFNLVLSPDYNADHADHFHVDMGWWRGCH